MGNAWKNTTSYSQGETDRTPRAWEINVAGARICVHRHRDYEPDMWVLSTYGVLDMCRLKPLVSKDADAAKAEALAWVGTRLADLVEAVRIARS